MSLQWRKSDYLAGLWMDWLDGSGTDPLPSPAGLFLSLYTVAPSDSSVSDGTEASYGNYGRASVSLGTKSGTDKVIRYNTNSLSFGTVASAEDFEVQAYVLWTAVTGGSPLYIRLLDSDEFIAVIETQEFIVDIGDLSIAEE